MTTTYLIGVDEAGYGPNLGPLVVAATVWQVDYPHDDRQVVNNGRSRAAPDPTRINWYRRLADRISPKPDTDRVAVADSKLLYSPAAGLTVLEEGVLAALVACERTAATWRQLIELLAADPNGDANTLPWHVSWDAVLPVIACPSRVERLSQCLAQGPKVGRRRASSRSALMKLQDIQACVVHAGAFNRLTVESGNKATALSRISLQLLGRVLGRLAPARNVSQPPAIVAVCDKHGGRNHYAPLLMEAFSHTLIQVQRESRAVSRYCVQTECFRADVSFKRGGESFLPTALASMTAKYLRELAMRAFNEYWCQQVTGLRPTAGYPRDSHRFKREIAGAQSDLGIDDDVLWRRR